MEALATRHSVRKLIPGSLSTFAFEKQDSVLDDAVRVGQAEKFYAEQQRKEGTMFLLTWSGEPILPSDVTVGGKKIGAWLGEEIYGTGESQIGVYRHLPTREGGDHEALVYLF
jgi:hypothetical protein